MKLGKILLCTVIIYLLIGFGYAVYWEITADPEDTPAPIWAPGLSLGERIGHFFLVFIPTVLLWPFLLPPTIWCLIKGTC
jgi:hypothetical protein